ncbi:MAG: 50S ribosomal protein L13 [Candidatus Micrarchaeota archaeon]|nr:50S ribosomal protein L13 [Candidatus Micrarchaeota archaeon]
MVVIDANGAVVGRLGARVAKLLLSGQEVQIINADKAIMVGSLSAARDKYFSRRQQKNKRQPENSPRWPRVPHLLLRRIIRGMLPWKSQRGREAYRRLKVFSGEAGEGKKLSIPEASGSGKHRAFTLSQLCLALGGKPN